MEWEKRAACRGAPLSEFFADDGEGLSRTRERMRRSARLFCALCPVLSDCARWADREGEVGLFAGVYRSSPGSHMVLLSKARPPKWRGSTGRARRIP
jgi:hypothetical protein